MMTLEALRQRWPPQPFTLQGETVSVVRTSGITGPPVLWLPGAQGTAEIFFKPLLAFGAGRAMVSITYPAWTDAVALADFVVALADRLEAPRFDLVGTSLGGHIAQWVAARHSMRVGRLVLGNTFHDPGPAQSAEKLQALQRGDAATVKAEALARVKASPDGELKAVQLDLVGQVQSAELLRSRMLAVQMARPPEPLGVPDERVLIIECDNDPLIPPLMRAALREAHPAALHVVVQGGGHYPYIVRAEAYNAAVGAFLGLTSA
jgi:maspardin